jgi:DNA polymerase III epsilon subunit
MGLLTVAPTPAQPVGSVTFVAFDLETTGLSAKNGRVVEIGAVRFRGNEVLGQQRWLVNPGMPIPENAQRVHGITDAMVADAPAFPDAYREFLTFIGEDVLMAHNARFDMRFLAAEAERHGMPQPTAPVIDTLAVARARLPGLSSYRLEDLVSTCQLPTGSFHRGLDDAAHLKSLLTVLTNQDFNALEDLVATGGLSFQTLKPTRR